MVRNAVGKVMWVGRGAVFLVGLLVILAAAFAVANAMLGIGGWSSLSEKSNGVDPFSQLAATTRRAWGWPWNP